MADWAGALCGCFHIGIFSFINTSGCNNIGKSPLFFLLFKINFVVFVAKSGVRWKQVVMLNVEYETLTVTY